jgi:hypothetical protein
MLLLEEISSHSPLLMQQSFLTRWFPTKGGVMIDSNHVKGIQIPLRKRICWTPRWTFNEKNGWSDQCEGCHDHHYSSNAFSHDLRSPPATQEDVMYMNGNNNGYSPQGGQTWNQSCPTIKEVIKVILSTQINIPWEILFFGKLRLIMDSTRKQLPMIKLWIVSTLKLIVFLLLSRTS